MQKVEADMDNNPDGARFEFVFSSDEGQRNALQSAVVESGLDPNYNRYYFS